MKQEITNQFTRLNYVFQSIVLKNARSFNIVFWNCDGLRLKCNIELLYSRWKNVKKTHFFVASLFPFLKSYQTSLFNSNRGTRHQYEQLHSSFPADSGLSRFFLKSRLTLVLVLTAAGWALIYAEPENQPSVGGFPRNEKKKIEKKEY